MSRSNSKRKNTKETKKKVQGHNSEITGIIFIACGILSAVSIYYKSSWILSYIFTEDSTFTIRNRRLM